MVILHAPQVNDDGKGNKFPVMPRHMLTAKVKTKTFVKGETAECFIAKMQDGRYEVFDANFGRNTAHMEVFTEQELHDCFDERI